MSYLRAVADGATGRGAVLARRRSSPFEGAFTGPEGLEEVAEERVAGAPRRAAAVPPSPAVAEPRRVLETVSTHETVSRTLEGPSGFVERFETREVPTLSPTPPVRAPAPAQGVLPQAAPQTVPPAPIPPAPPATAHTESLVESRTLVVPSPLVPVPSETPLPVLAEPSPTVVESVVERLVPEASAQREATRALEANAPASLAAPRAPEAAPTPVAPPAVHVSIGRIEVRASAPSAPARRPSGPARPRVDLDAYLRSRSGGAS